MTIGQEEKLNIIVKELTQLSNELYNNKSTIEKANKRDKKISDDIDKAIAILETTIDFQNLF